jgi:DNA-binding response OmpR family regulator
MERRAQIGVVEESEDNRALIVELLVSAGLEVVAFARIEDLIAEGDRAPALAVADAWTVWQRERELCAVVPSRSLLVLTTAEVHTSVWRELGATRILRKPFYTTEFLQSVRELTQSAPAP